MRTMDNTKSTIEKLFEKGLELHHYANTAYPLDGHKVWRDFRATEGVDDAVKAQWKDVDELGLYVHIPFCKQRCLYCEYSVLSGGEADRKDEYVGLLLKEIGLYRQIMAGKKTVGMDIGGGTPTILDVESIERIVKAVLEGYTLSDGFGMSIETTPIIANDAEKMRAIRQMGIERISMGVQSIDPKILKEVGRIDSSLAIVTGAVDTVRKAGFERLNLDIMYGFLGQSVESFAATTQFAIDMAPEYITLYRNRYKGTKLEAQAKDVQLDDVNKLYDASFELLAKNGYQENFGKNTFSRIKGDPGTSEYLTRRVIDGTPYLGMGLGAQSMGESSIYYNQGAASKMMGRYRELLEAGHFPVQDMYLLPPDEMMAKMICVSFYFGYINKPSFEKRFGISLQDKFGDEMEFLKNKGLMEEDDKLLYLTKEGKDAVNGIIPLFYSPNSRQNLLEKVVKSG
jgi:oxygen-independent coproporphyrinogen III oxidase